MYKLAILGAALLASRSLRLPVSFAKNNKGM